MPDRTQRTEGKRKMSGTSQAENTVPAGAAGADPVRMCQATAVRVPEVEAEMGRAYERRGPLGTISRQLLIPCPRPNASSVISCDYTGASGLRRYERLMYQSFDDVYQDPEIRFSNDNGRTWTPWEADAANDIVRGVDLWWQWNCNGITAGVLDPESGLLVRAAMLRGFQGGDPRRAGLKTLHHFVFTATSADDGHTWGPWKQLKYEPGPEYSEAARETPEFLARNQCHYYFNIIAPRSGGLMLPVVSATQVTDEKGGPRSFACPRCFLGKWNPSRNDYDWTASGPVTVSPALTGYLEEPWLAELAGGELLLDMRGTNRGATGWGPETGAPGRHWQAVSRDGGRTWSKVEAWRYDTGATFFSPATMAKILRHSGTGKLYWFGNISAGPTSGNSPRFPFYIGEIDESKPALKKSTLTVIDDYDAARHSPEVQFSNFFVFENRQTRQFEVYLSPYGQYGAATPEVYQANVYKYVITLKGGLS